MVRCWKPFFLSLHWKNKYSLMRASRTDLVADVWYLFPLVTYTIQQGGLVSPSC